MDKKQSRLRRGRQTRAKIAELKVNRLAVYRTNLHTYASIIGPDAKILASASLRLFGHGVERHGVRIVDEDQIVELLVPGEAHGLHRHAFLHAPIARQADDVMVEDRVLLRVEPGFGHFCADRHSHRIRDALTEGSGRRLDAARGMGHLGVPRGLRVKLPKAFDLVERQVRIAAEVEPRLLSIS